MGPGDFVLLKSPQARQTLWRPIAQVMHTQPGQDAGLQPSSTACGFSGLRVARVRRTMGRTEKMAIIGEKARGWLAGQTLAEWGWKPVTCKHPFFGWAAERGTREGAFGPLSHV